MNNVALFLSAILAFCDRFFEESDNLGRPGPSRGLFFSDAIFLKIL
jgi:hypothetical protein